MTAELRQRRAAIAQAIRENGRIVSGTRQPTKDNGFGVQIPDPDATPVSLPRARVRIARERASIPGSVETPVGLGTNLAEFLLQDYHLPFREDDLITDGTTTWQVGHVNTFLCQGRIYGADAALTRRQA